MSNSKRPLARSEKREIWVSFWLHAIVAAVFGALGIVAAYVGYIADLHPVLRLIILGVPNFLIWASFVTKIRKYQDSTGISYPSTYFAIAIGCGVLVIGPLLMFLLLLIRMLRVPTLEDSKDHIANVGIVPSGPNTQSSLVKSSLLRQASAERPQLEQVIVLKQQDDASPPHKADIMKPIPEQKPSATPILDDEPFYEEVARELEVNEMKPGLWAKAFAEADGDEERVKAIYIRLRVAQLMSAREAELKELQRLEDERIKAAEEEARIKSAREKAARVEAAELERKRQEEATRLEAERKAARLKAAELDKQKQEAEAEEARLEAERKAAMRAEQERYENSPARIRQKATERFVNEFGNLEPYPAKISIGRDFIYFFKEYDLIIGPDDILFSSRKNDQPANILVSPKLGDRVTEFFCWEFDINAKIVLADGTLLRLYLGWKARRALKDWTNRSHKAYGGY